MGKHETLKYSYEPPRNEFYEARIQTLEKENLDLRRRIDQEEEADRHAAEMHVGVVRELEARIAELEEENYKLREAVIKAVTA